MDIKYICEFVHLAETCSFQETATELYVSQSSLTKHIQAIEQELGVKLFNRSTRKVVLNRFGKVFYSYAKQIADLSVDYTNAMKYLMYQSEYLLNVGALGYMNFYGLYETLANFKKSYPKVKYSVTEEKDAQLKTKLETGEISFVFTANVQQYQEYKYCIWKTDSLVLIVSDQHPLAKSETVHLEELKNYDIIAHGPPAEYPLFEKACKNCGFTPHVSAQVSFSSTIISLVKGNHGISVMNAAMLPDRDSSGVTIIPIVPRIETNIYCVYADDALSTTEKNFLEFIQSKDI